MRIFFGIITGISLIILASGTIAYVLDGPTFGGGCILVAAWVTITVLAIVQQGEPPVSKGKKNADSAKQSKRLSECETRLRDLQDIVLANDEKIKRLERETLVTPIDPKIIRD